MLYRLFRTAPALAAALALSSCSNSGSPSSPIARGPAPAVTASPATTSLPTATPSPAATPLSTTSPSPAASPLPTATTLPTATPAPTVTPAPTATPAPTSTPSPVASGTAVTSSCGFDDTHFACEGTLDTVPGDVTAGGSPIGEIDYTQISVSAPNTRGPVTLTSTFFDRGSLAGLSGYGRVAAAQLAIAGPAADVASGAGGNIILGFEQRSVDDPADGLYALTSFTCRLFDGTTLLGSSVATVGRVTTPPGPESYATCTAGYPTPQYYTLDPIGDQQGIVIPNVVHVGHTYTFTIDAM